MRASFLVLGRPRRPFGGPGTTKRPVHRCTGRRTARGTRPGGSRPSSSCAGAPRRGLRPSGRARAATSGLGWIGVRS